MIEVIVVVGFIYCCSIISIAGGAAGWASVFRPVWLHRSEPGSGLAQRL